MSPLFDCVLLSYSCGYSRMTQRGWRASSQRALTAKRCQRLGQGFSKTLNPSGSLCCCRMHLVVMHAQLRTCWWLTYTLQAIWWCVPDRAHTTQGPPGSQHLQRGSCDCHGCLHATRGSREGEHGQPCSSFLINICYETGVAQATSDASCT